MLSEDLMTESLTLFFSGFVRATIRFRTTTTSLPIAFINTQKHKPQYLPQYLGILKTIKFHILMMVPTWT